MLALQLVVRLGLLRLGLRLCSAFQSLLTVAQPCEGFNWVAY
jgi:hypothetical protein